MVDCVHEYGENKILRESTDAGGNAIAHYESKCKYCGHKRVKIHALYKLGVEVRD